MGRIVIVGAGPAGATLAYLLARRGIDVTLIERQSDFAREFRGEVLMPSGLDALAQTGLGPIVATVPQVHLRAIVVYVLGRLLMRTTFPAEMLDTGGPVWMSQPALLEALVAEAGRHPSFRFERGASVVDLMREDGRVVGVRTRTRDGTEELRAELVVGADGRASIVRKRIDPPVRSDHAAFDVVWCKVPLPRFFTDDPHARAYAGHGHLLIASPTPDEMLQIGWVIRKGRFGELRERGIPEWLDELATHVSPDLAAHLRTHRNDVARPFLLDVRSDRVRRWSGPGTLLIGDAAHIMSPVGGQGLNLALRDALEAANVLVPALLAGTRGRALDAAARRVEELRAPEIVEIQRLQAIPPRFVLSNAWWSPLLLRVLPRVLIGRRGGGRVFQRFAFGVTEVRLRV